MSFLKQDKLSIGSIQHPFWSMKIEEVWKILQSSQSGLTEEEVDLRKKIFGQNTIVTKRRLPRLKIVFNQVKSPLILILIIAGSVTVYLHQWIDAGVIFAAVLVNTVLGYWQENKAENVLELLKTYIKTRARVRRSGQEREIDASSLVPGDVIRITQGDRVPADARLIFVNNLEVDEAVLTGESRPAEKNPSPLPVSTALTSRASMIFSGTLAAQGFADAIVTATGSKTEFGKIARLVSEAGFEDTPLRKSIASFAKFIGIALFMSVTVLFNIGLLIGYGSLEMFLIAVAVAVSAVPEGLPIALTVILAVGVQRLAERKGVVRKLLAAETLGSTSVILTDKTGTLTEAKMDLAEVLPFGVKDHDSVRNVIVYALVNTDIVLENPEDSPEEWRIFGRSLEASLVKSAAKFGVIFPDIMSKTKIIDRLQFDSARKYSASISQTDSKYRINILGAPEIIAAFTNLKDQDKLKVYSEIEQRAEKGGRVLGVISKEVDRIPARSLREAAFSNFDFLGLLVFSDPLRPKVKEAIKKISSAGVRTIIVTGDHQGTAEAIARDLGLIDGKGAVLTGDDLNYLTEEEIKQRADQVSVYARVTPEQKVNIVKLYKEKGEVVAVTGDGINDAPALHIADIGIAVGSGTDVTKSAADLVLLDDNFETIVAAIEEGRRILNNIRKVIVYLLSDVFDELFLIGGALAVGVALPLNALQILFVNFFSDSFPAIAFAFEKGIDDLGDSPSKIRKNLFDREMRFLILIIGTITSAFLFFLYLWLLKRGFDQDLVKTFIFVSFSTYTLIFTFSLRSLSKSILDYNPFSNIYLTLGVFFGIILTLVAVYSQFFQKILGTSPLPVVWLWGVLGVGVINIIAIEIGKWIFRKKL